VGKNVKLIKWNNDFSVSNVFFDNQHKKFIRILNNLANAINNDCKIKTQDVFFELIYYIEHYMIEKDVTLINCDIKKYIKHKKLHNKLLKKVEECYQKLSNSPNISECCTNLYSYLRNWFVSYIKLIKQNNFNECWKQNNN